VPSAAIPSEVVRIPVSCVMENVGVLLPSRFTVNAATWEVPDRQLAIIVPAPAAGAFCTLRVEQFWCVEKVRDGTITAGKI